MNSFRIYPVLIGALVLALAPRARAEMREPQPRDVDRVWSGLLIDRSLSAARISVIEIDTDGIVYLDEAGRRRRSTISSVMALLPTPGNTGQHEGIGAVGSTDKREAQGQSESGYVALTDGQRFPGQYVPTSAGEDTIIWHHPQFGDVEFALDDVAWIVRDDNARAVLGEFDEVPVEDELILVNGDRIRGFIIGLGDPVEIESGEGVIKLDMQRVSGAVFSNPRDRLKGLIVWLNDGTTAQVESEMQMTSDELTVSLPDGQSAIYDIGELRAVAFDAGRFVALSSIEPTESEPVGTRLYAPPSEKRAHPHDEGLPGRPALDAHDIFIPGPMRLEYELPAGASRLSGTASLADGTFPWGDCELVLEIDGEEVYRRRLNAEQPSVAFNIELDGDRLGVVIEPGRYGPILDLVFLRRALILVGAGGR